MDYNGQKDPERSASDQYDSCFFFFFTTHSKKKKKIAFDSVTLYTNAYMHNSNKNFTKQF